MNTSTISSNSEERMGTAPIFKLMLSMGIPTFVAQLINLLYNIVDRIYIGHIPEVGAASLTGIGLCLPIITLVSAFSVFVGAGGAPLASIALCHLHIEETASVFRRGQRRNTEAVSSMC